MKVLQIMMKSIFYKLPVLEVPSSKLTSKSDNNSNSEE